MHGGMDESTLASDPPASIAGLHARLARHCLKTVSSSRLHPPLWLPATEHVKDADQMPCLVPENRILAQTLSAAPFEQSAQDTSMSTEFLAWLQNWASAKDIYTDYLLIKSAPHRRN